MKIPISFALCLLLHVVCFAQGASLHISVLHSTSAAVELTIFSRTLSQDLFKKGSLPIPVDRQGSAFWTGKS